MSPLAAEKSGATVDAFLTRLRDHVEDEVKHVAQEIYDRHAKEMAAELSKERDRIVASVGLHISKSLSIDTMGSTVTIQIRKEEL